MKLNRKSFGELIENPSLKSLYYSLLIKELKSSVNYPLDEVYLNIDKNLLDEIKVRCQLFHSFVYVDYFFVNENGQAIVNLNLLIEYAKKNKLKELLIPEGFNYILSEGGYVNYAGKIVFPSTLLGMYFNFSFQNINSISYENLDNSLLSICVYDYHEFGVLDFSKCLNIKYIGPSTFKSMKIKELILPESLERIDYNFCDEKYVYIDKIYINSPISFLTTITKNMIIKNNRIKSFNNVYLKDIIDELIIIEGGKLNGSASNIKNLYFPISKNILLNDIDIIKQSVDLDEYKYHFIRYCKFGISDYNPKLNILASHYFQLIFGINPYTQFILSLILRPYINNMSDLYDNFLKDLYKDDMKGIINHNVYFYNSDIDLDEVEARDRKYNMFYNYENKYIYLDDELVDVTL